MAKCIFEYSFPLFISFPPIVWKAAFISARSFAFLISNVYFFIILSMSQHSNFIPIFPSRKYYSVIYILEVSLGWYNWPDIFFFSNSVLQCFSFIHVWRYMYIYLYIYKNFICCRILWISSHYLLPKCFASMKISELRIKLYMTFHLVYTVKILHFSSRDF